jgi:hypothetical protein
VIKSDKFDLFFNQILELREQEEKLFEWEVEKFNIIAQKNPKHGLKYHYILGTNLQV